MQYHVMYAVEQRVLWDILQKYWKLDKISISYIQFFVHWFVVLYEW